MKNAEYTFGTSSAAAARLEEIAEYFNPLAAALIRRFVSKGCGAAVDLGCGPGFTTNMLAEAASCRKTYGLDNSREFLEMATRRFAHCTFLEHDVTKVPFPVTADVMYARFLLCHLTTPLELVAAWMTQLNSEGLLFVDEMDAIDTDLEVFKTYIAMAEGIIAAQGGSLYIGKVSAAAAHEADVLMNESAVLPVTNHQAASWFFPNTQTIWKENQYVLEHLGAKERDAVSRELERLKAERDSRSDITWRLRRLVLRKQAD